MVGVIPISTQQILKQKMVPVVTSDECKHYTESAQDLMCIGGDNGKQIFLNNIWLWDAFESDCCMLRNKIMIDSKILLSD